MDRQRRQLIVLAAALSGLAASVWAKPDAPEPVTLRELAWLEPEGRVEALTSEPVLDRARLFDAVANSAIRAQYSSADALRDELLIGEAVFKTPLLLGGQAAKAGMSCHSCHASGRGNPHFRFPAISGAAGTADTTHSFFSETLGNGVFDPVPIPDLAQPGKVSHDLATGELEGFIDKIVVEEFSGRESARAAIRPLATFVRAVRLSGAAKGPAARQPRSAARDLADAARIVGLVKRLPQDRIALASLLLFGARDRLAVIHGRLIPGQHDRERGWLVAQSRHLGAVQAMLGQLGEAGALAAQLRIWDAGMAQAPDFAAIEPATLYRAEILEAYLSQRP